MAMGKRATYNMLCIVCFICVASDRLPIVIYISHAFLSPQKLVRWVASDMNSIGTSMPPAGIVVYIIVSIVNSIRRKLTCLFHHQSPVCITL